MKLTKKQQKMHQLQCIAVEEFSRRYRGTSADLQTFVLGMKAQEEIEKKFDKPKRKVKAWYY